MSTISSAALFVFLALITLHTSNAEQQKDQKPQPRLLQHQDVVRVKTFFSSSVVALLVGMERGIFEGRNLLVNHTYTKSSGELRGDLASGAIDIAYAVSDNSVYMGTDAVILTGGDSSMNEFVVQDYVENFGDIRGEILIVDAPNTAYALQAYKALDNAGLSPGTYDVEKIGGTNIRYAAMTSNSSLAASALSPPFSIMATRQDGLRSLGRMIDLAGPYQASSLFVMREWATLNGGVILRFIASWVESLRWVMDPANEDAVIEILMKTFGTDANTTQIEYEMLMEPDFGLTPDMAFLEDGFENVLDIRNQSEGDGPYNASDYVNLSYYEEALTLLSGDEVNSTSDVQLRVNPTSDVQLRLPTSRMQSILMSAAALLASYIYM